MTSRQIPPGLWIEGRYFGLDEAGRGAMAGPLSVAVVEYPWPCADALRAVNDSKKLSPKTRARLAEIIQHECRSACVMIDPAFIDEYGIDEAEATGALRAMAQLVDKEHSEPATVVLDGMPACWGDLKRFNQVEVQFMIKGDQHLPPISAASIVAKVTRDQYMIAAGIISFPEYSFEQHKGYVTAQHLQELERWGPCVIHRRSVKPVAERIARA